ncbi:glycosyltransferase family 2 protein [Caenimonas aquaedulcis]|uniref:Glycosyltransferase family 2 protein n=1 Tax=Caenimonas aquaedulcis TaxID=2793270 RepID=A0A931MIB2_9BURK|nr:glycosyltransferase [Caenimonas aquaedulcis]MBG9389060.1 glycosyltransferase family 2 protein [Caenimonas aquaedulcis]
MNDAPRLDLSVVIPTYRRDRVLVATLESLLALAPRAGEILVMDQTERHDAATEERLAAFDASGDIRWVRLPEPSITAAMNRGLELAACAVVLFLDDDIRPEPGLLVGHAAAHGHGPAALVAGRVIQPWQESLADFDAGDFHFAQTRPAELHEFMGGNFSLPRELALRLRGFDENFVRVAYRFEAEFAHRLRAAGARIRFEPAACLHHLKASDGGTRTFGGHLTTWRPDHAVGAYYHGLRTGSMGVFLTRPLRAVATRYHLRHPWRIPPTLLAEFGGMAWALALLRRGPRLLPLREAGTGP